MASGTVSLGLRSTDESSDVPSQQSQFDPMELLGSRDPFRQDWRKLEELSSITGLSMLTHPKVMLAAHPVCQAPRQGCVISSPQHIIQVVPKVPGARPELSHSYAELQEASFRLTPALAIHIFNQGPTKTKLTAALLSAEFGVSAKAIRDIWTKRTWAQETHPYWTLENKQYIDSPGAAQNQHAGDATAAYGNATAAAADGET